MSSRYPSFPALLGNRFWPITQEIGFVEAPFTDVIDSAREWLAGIGSYPSRPMVGSLEEHLSALLPLTGPQARHVWVATNGNWTAYFDNTRGGSDPWGPIPVLRQRLACRGAALLWVPHPRAAHRGTRFDLYGHPDDTSLNNSRQLQAMVDDDDRRWLWYASGPVQPFESTEAYLARRVRDRLTPEMIDRYAQALGIRPFDAGFYGQYALLVENGNIRVKLLEESLAEAQAGMECLIQG
jgi:hypothetical protein